MSKQATRPDLDRARLGPTNFLSGHAHPWATTVDQAQAHRLFFRARLPEWPREVHQAQEAHRPLLRGVEAWRHV